MPIKTKDGVVKFFPKESPIVDLPIICHQLAGLFEGNISILADPPCLPIDSKALKEISNFIQCYSSERDLDLPLSRLVNIVMNTDCLEGEQRDFGIFETACNCYVSKFCNEINLKIKQLDGQVPQFLNEWVEKSFEDGSNMFPREVSEKIKKCLLEKFINFIKEKYIGSKGKLEYKNWDSRSFKRDKSLMSFSAGNNAPIAFSRDGKIAIGTCDGKIELYDFKTKKRINSFLAFSPTTKNISFVFNEDGNFLACVELTSEGILVKLWDAKQGRCFAAYEIDRKDAQYESNEAFQTTWPIVVFQCFC